MSVRIFYKNIQVRNLNNLPTDRPVLLTSNHPNSFMDAIVLSVLVKQKLNSLVRSDVFNTPLKRWFLAQIGLTPIYRLQEGKDQLYKNAETFDKCYEILRANKTILVFSEGICIQERRLRKLKKGTARIALGAEESRDFKLGLVVVPVGINYSKPKNFRSDVFVNFGEAFEMTEFIDVYKHDKVKGINSFTKFLQEKMTQLLVVIEDKANDTFVEHVEEIFKKQELKILSMDSKNLEHHFQFSSRITQKINDAHKQTPEKIEHVKTKTEQYQKQIYDLKLRDHLFIKDNSKISFFIFVRNCLLLLLGLPLHIYGLINNYLPYKIAHSTTNKVVKLLEFHSSVNIAMGTLLFLIFYIVQTLLIAFLFPLQVLVIYLLSLPLSGVFCLYYFPFLKKTMGVGRLLLLKNNNKTKFEELLNQRMGILNLFEELEINQ